MNLKPYILPFYQKLEVALYYLKYTPYTDKVNKLADLLNEIKSRYKISSTCNDWLINAQNREVSDYFTDAEIWYRNAYIDFEAKTKKKIKEIFPSFDVFFL